MEWVLEEDFVWRWVDSSLKVCHWYGWLFIGYGGASIMDQVASTVETRGGGGGGLTVEEKGERRGDVKGIVLGYFVVASV